MIYNYIYYTNYLVTYDSITGWLELPSMKLKIKFDRRPVPYNGKYVNYFGPSTFIITEDKNLNMMIGRDDYKRRQVELSNLPDAMYPMYYSCVLQYRGVYRLYSDTEEGRIIDPPLYDIHAFGSHYLYSYTGNEIQVTSITRKLTSPEWSHLSFPLGNVKRILPLNIPFIVQTDDNKYYLNFIGVNVDYNILGTIYKSSGYDWVHLPELDRLGTVDLVYLFSTVHVWSNGKTYHDNTVLDGLYTVSSKDTNVHKLYEGLTTEIRKYTGFYDIEIITVI